MINQKKLSPIILIFNKPYEVLCSFTDPEGRDTLKKYIPVEGVYPVGRLDFDSEGMLLLTNDGVLIHRLTSPAHQVAKTYLVQIEGLISSQALATLQRGVMVKGERTRRCQAMIVPEVVVPERSKPVTPHKPTQWLRLVLREGRKRQIRHMTAAVGYPTLRLIRVAIGPLGMEGLQPGEWRELTKDEESRLRRVVQLPV
jgi:23S rRNA pseudouridine2457 synthase